MQNVWSWIRHNSFFFSSSIIVLAVLLWTYGCESNVSSLKQPHLRVNRAELLLELQDITAQAELRISELDKKDEFKETLFGMAVLYAKGGTINPIAVALTVSSMLGFGAVIDNRRKDTVIKTMKSNGAPPPIKTT